MFSPSIMHPFYETRDAPFGLVGIAAPQHGQILSNHASHCSFFLLSAQASSLLSFLSTPRYLRFQWPPQKCRRFVRPLTLVLIQSPNKSNTNYSSAVFNLMLLSLVRPVSHPVSLFCAFQSRLYCVKKAISNLSVLATRSNRFGKVDAHQHHIRVTPHRLEGQA
jgi:hypothetical protein